ncbi:twin arginine translocase protein A [Symmachiella macrocystis]|uniref:Sec-independent protein translocase protein TatA n=1 Tax=Symmachiella macrocystis TaxID=2527985 RepID=A0A5C6BL09_9PLAN|nr:twin-arginine translocase TatA/TatE family subunit [Symmachiella macrocystis]TWU12337.1 twin arginine translocase protein A [Symmachiella macrocystis]
MHTPILAFFGAPGPMEMMIIGGIALLLFGKRLPEVARSMGKGIVEFKKGVSGIEDEVDKATYSTSTPSSSARPIANDETEPVTSPKFEPPVAEPTDVNSESV